MEPAYPSPWPPPQSAGLWHSHPHSRSQPQQQHLHQYPHPSPQHGHPQSQYERHHLDPPYPDHVPTPSSSSSTHLTLHAAPSPDPGYLRPPPFSLPTQRRSHRPREGSPTPAPRAKTSARSELSAVPSHLPTRPASATAAARAGTKRSRGSAPLSPPPSSPLLGPSRRALPGGRKRKPDPTPQEGGAKGKAVSGRAMPAKPKAGRLGTGVEAGLGARLGAASRSSCGGRSDSINSVRERKRAGGHVPRTRASRSAAGSPAPLSPFFGSPAASRTRVLADAGAGGGVWEALQGDGAPAMTPSLTAGSSAPSLSPKAGFNAVASTVTGGGGWPSPTKPRSAVPQSKVGASAPKARALPGFGLGLVASGTGLEAEGSGEKAGGRLRRRRAGGDVAGGKGAMEALLDPSGRGRKRTPRGHKRDPSPMALGLADLGTRGTRTRGRTGASDGFGGDADSSLSGPGTPTPTPMRPAKKRRLVLAVEDRLSGRVNSTCHGGIGTDMDVGIGVDVGTNVGMAAKQPAAFESGLRAVAGLAEGLMEGAGVGTDGWPAWLGQETVKGPKQGKGPDEQKIKDTLRMAVQAQVKAQARRAAASASAAAITVDASLELEQARDGAAFRGVESQERRELGTFGTEGSGYTDLATSWMALQDTGVGDQYAAMQIDPALMDWPDLMTSAAAERGAEPVQRSADSTGGDLSDVLPRLASLGAWKLSVDGATGRAVLVPTATSADPRLRSESMPKLAGQATESKRWAFDSSDASNALRGSGAGSGPGPLVMDDGGDNAKAAGETVVAVLDGLGRVKCPWSRLVREVGEEAARRGIKKTEPLLPAQPPTMAAGAGVGPSLWPAASSQLEAAGVSPPRISRVADWLEDAEGEDDEGPPPLTFCAAAPYATEADTHNAEKSEDSSDWWTTLPSQWYASEEREAMERAKARAAARARADADSSGALDGPELEEEFTTVRGNGGKGLQRLVRYRKRAFDGEDVLGVSPLPPGAPKPAKRGAGLGRRVAEEELEQGHVACPCGRWDDTVGMMVQCDGCRGRYHLSCLGILDPAALPGSWNCLSCVSRRAAMLRRQEQEPTFAQSAYSPRLNGGLAHGTTALAQVALAPSPMLCSGTGPRPEITTAETAAAAEACPRLFGMASPIAPLYAPQATPVPPQAGSRDDYWAGRGEDYSPCSPAQDGGDRRSGPTFDTLAADRSPAGPSLGSFEGGGGFEDRFWESRPFATPKQGYSSHWDVDDDVVERRQSMQASGGSWPLSYGPLATPVRGMHGLVTPGASSPRWRAARHAPAPSQDFLDSLRSPAPGASSYGNAAPGSPFGYAAPSSPLAPRSHRRRASSAAFAASVYASPTRRAGPAFGAVTSPSMRTPSPAKSGDHARLGSHPQGPPESQHYHHHPRDPAAVALAVAMQTPEARHLHRGGDMLLSPASGHELQAETFGARPSGSVPHQQEQQEQQQQGRRRRRRRPQGKAGEAGQAGLGIGVVSPGQAAEEDFTDL